MDNEVFYTIPEVAAKLKVTRAAVYKWMKQGKLGYVIVGSERRVTSSTLGAFIKSGHVGTGSDGVKSEEIREPDFVAMPA